MTQILGCDAIYFNPTLIGKPTLEHFDNNNESGNKVKETHGLKLISTVVLNHE